MAAVVVVAAAALPGVVVVRLGVAAVAAVGAAAAAGRPPRQSTVEGTGGRHASNHFVTSLKPMGTHACRLCTPRTARWASGCRTSAKRTVRSACGWRGGRQSVPGESRRIKWLGWKVSGLSGRSTTVGRSVGRNGFDRCFASWNNTGMHACRSDTPRTARWLRGCRTSARRTMRSACGWRGGRQSVAVESRRIKWLGWKASVSSGRQGGAGRASHCWCSSRFVNKVAKRIEGGRPAFIRDQSLVWCATSEVSTSLRLFN